MPVTCWEKWVWHLKTAREIFEKSARDKIRCKFQNIYIVMFSFFVPVTIFQESALDIFQKIARNIEQGAPDNSQKRVATGL